MSTNLLNTIYLAAAFLALFASAEILYHVYKVQAEITRKYVHIATGFITMLFPPLINNHWLVLALCGSFLIILLASMQFKLLPSINAVNRDTMGSLLYPVIVYGCYLASIHFNSMSYYFIPILIMAVCDPIAALVGKKYNFLSYTIFGKKKTFTGSFAFFLSAALLSLTLLTFFPNNLNHIFLSSLAIALVTAFFEGIAHKGYDNLTIPASSVLLMYLMERI